MDQQPQQIDIGQLKNFIEQHCSAICYLNAFTQPDDKMADVVNTKLDEFIVNLKSKGVPVEKHSTTIKAIETFLGGSIVVTITGLNDPLTVEFGVPIEIVPIKS